MTDTMIVNVPFSGFYYSLWSDGIDREEEQYAEYFAEELQAEEGVPEHLRLDQGEVAEILFDVTDYSACHLEVAREYAEAFNDFATERLGHDLGMTFETMTSPRFYNFETDRVFCYIPTESVKWLFAKSAEDEHDTLADVIRSRFTSRDGFISGYSNDLETWLEKPLEDWDHNEVGTLLLAVLGDYDELDDLYYRIADCDGFYHEWQEGVDWEKFDAKVAELREEKVEEWAEEHPEVPAPYRCPNTLDLFANL